MFEKFHKITHLQHVGTYLSFYSVWSAENKYIENPPFVNVNLEYVRSIRIRSVLLDTYLQACDIHQTHTTS